MLLDAGVIAACIFIFARYNAEGGFLRSFLMLLGVIIASLVLTAVLPASLRFLVLAVYIVLLAAGLTFVCGTQPGQTAKILGVFISYRLLLWGVPVLITRFA